MKPLKNLWEKMGNSVEKCGVTMSMIENESVNHQNM